MLCVAALLLEAGALRTGLLQLSLVYPVYYTLHSLQLDLRARQTPLREPSSRP